MFSFKKERRDTVYRTNEGRLEILRRLMATLLKVKETANTLSSNVICKGEQWSWANIGRG